MVSVDVIMDWLNQLVDSDTKLSSPSVDLKHSAQKNFQERVHLVQSLMRKDGCELEMAEDTDVCEKYLAALFLLLDKLNDLIGRQMETFLEQEEATPAAKKTEHTVPALSPDVISIGHQAVLAKVFQFVATLGIVPHLLPGVGVPIATRSKFGGIISSLVISNLNQLENNINRLLAIIEPANIRAVFMSRHLGDLLAALVQLSHTCHPTDQSQPAKISISQSSDGESQSHQSPSNPRHFRAELSDLISRSYQPLIVRELLVLQSGGGNKTPAWLRAVCGHHLTRILVAPGGVKHIVAGMISSDTEDWRKFELVGRVIATPPKQWSTPNYYQLIGPQVLSLLQDSDALISRQYGRVCAAVMCSVAAKHPALFKSTFWQPLSADLKSGNSAKQERCLSCMYKVICCSAEPQSILLTHCLQALPDIFTIYMPLHSSPVVTDSRMYCEELLAACMKYADSSSISSFLHHVTFTYEPQPAGNSLEAEDSRTAAILFCVEKITNTDLVQKYYVSLLEKLTELFSRVDNSSDDVYSELSPLIVEKFKLMLLLSSLSSSHSKACLKEPQYIIKFVKSCLEHFLNNVSLESFNLNTHPLDLSLGLLEALMSGASDVKLSEANVALLRKLDQPLNQLSMIDNIPSDTRERALNIRVAIVTQGLVWLNKLSKGTSFDSITKTADKKAPVIEVLTESKASNKLNNLTSESTCDTMTAGATPTSQSVGDVGDTSTSQKSTQADSKEQVPCDASSDSYSKALLELGDHLIAVKGHALIELARCIERKDKSAMDSRHQLQTLLVEHLSHSDSYIYLSAIRALAALADVHPADVLPALCEQYKNTNIIAETRLKVGEVITKATRQLGDLAPSYSSTVLPAVLIGCKSADEMLRASSLVNLGELCKLLRYSMGSHLYEIMECLSASLIGSCQSSRKGAAYSVSLIVSHLERESYDVIGADCLSTLYRSLKRCLDTDNDDVTTHHCSLAVAALDELVKDLFVSSDKLEKRIFVLDPPS